MFITLFFRLFLILMLTCLSSSQVFSADLPTLANQEYLRSQERIRQLRDQQELTPDVRESDIQFEGGQAKASDLLSDQESPCFVIQRVLLEGEQASQFDFALQRALTHPWTVQDRQELELPQILGRCLGAKGVRALLNRVQNILIEEGYVTTRVLAPAQDLSKGILKLQVVPGLVNEIRFSSNSTQRSTFWNVLPTQSGDVLNIRDIEQGLENLKRLPMVEADIKIEPSTSTGSVGVGLSDLVISRTQHDLFKLSANIDDSGSKATGKFQGGATLSAGHLLASQDLFYVNYNRSLGGGLPGYRGNDGYVLHYSLPFDYWLLSTTATSSQYYQAVAGATQNYLYRGRSNLQELKLNRLVFRDAVGKLNFSLRGFLRDSANYIDDTEIEVQRRRTAGIDWGVNQSWFLGGGLLDYNLFYRQGVRGLKALTPPEEFFGEGQGRMRMLLGDVTLSLPFATSLFGESQSFQYTALFRGQHHFTPLTPQDRFGIGNRFTVRGFDGERVLVGDSGWFLRQDVAYFFDRRSHSVYLGVDYGRVDGPSTMQLLGHKIAGGVIGMRGQIVKIPSIGQINYDIFIGRAIYQPQGFNNPSVVGGFSVNVSL